MRIFPTCPPAARLPPPTVPVPNGTATTDPCVPAVLNHVALVPEAAHEGAEVTAGSR
jgi:hypothetical protein